MDYSLPGFSLCGFFQVRIYCSGLPFPFPGDLPNPGTSPGHPPLSSFSEPLFNLCDQASCLSLWLLVMTALGQIPHLCKVGACLGPHRHCSLTALGPVYCPFNSLLVTYDQWSLALARCFHLESVFQLYVRNFFP